MDNGYNSNKVYAYKKQIPSSINDNNCYDNQ